MSENFYNIALHFQRTSTTAHFSKSRLTEFCIRNYLRVYNLRGIIMVSGGFNAKRQLHQRDASCSSVTLIFKIGGFCFFAVWFATMIYHIWPHVSRVSMTSSANTQSLRTEIMPSISATVESIPFEETDDSYHIVFSTGCSEFQDWQSIGVYSSAKAVGQRGIITRIASGCTKDQEAALTHAMSHLPYPTKWRIHFAPNTDVKDHSGHFYKYANKPLGMMHWLMHAEPKVGYSN
jgi:hypothetical protein